ncbi:MAG: tetratricopeptide repeat protein, partial [Candidatus Eisenbacteria sp.]|nr:tetratricopeptide repeat protein [Candidatus Eisenbacteria bacterium]
SADPEQEYFCDGTAEEIINALTKLKGLRVVARTSAFAFKDEKLDVREIGKKLNVGTVLEGSVRKAGNRLRITAQLVNVADGYHMWSERYDREMEDVFDIQDEISAAIVECLEPKLLGEQVPVSAARPTDDLEAYNLYLKGRHLWNKRVPAEVKKALDCFRRALDRDPDYAQAYVGVADCALVLENFHEMKPEDAFREADAAVRRALENDDSVAEAHASLGWIRMLRDWDWDAAETELLRAIELNPGYATARQWQAIYFVVTGRPEEALTESRRAQELDPLSPIIGAIVGNTLGILGRHDEAIVQYDSVLEIDPSFSYAHIGLSEAYLAKGKYEEAIAEIEKGISYPGAGGWRDVSLAYIHAVAGKDDEARRLLAQTERLVDGGPVHPSSVAAVYVALGEKERALDWLEKACAEPSSEVLRVMTVPVFDVLSCEPRFMALRRKVGLPR